MSLKTQLDALATRIGNYLRDSVLPRLVPAGGTAGQVLTKLSATDYDDAWQTPASGGGGAVEFVRINGNSGAAGEYKTLQKLSANSADNTTITPAVMITTTGVGVGVWKFEYAVLYQTAATATGIRLSINHTGTSAKFSMHSDFVSTGAAAATGVHDGTSSVATAGIHEGHAENTINTTSKATVGVSTANIDKLLYIRGILEVTAIGDLQFKFASEIAGSAVRLMATSNLELTKIG